MHQLPCKTTIYRQKKIIRGEKYKTVVFNVPAEYRNKHRIETGDEVVWMVTPNNRDIFLHPLKRKPQIPEGFVAIHQISCQANGHRGMVVALPKIWAQSIRDNATLTLYETPNGDLGVRR